MAKKTNKHLDAANRKNKNALTVIQQKRKAKKIAERAARELDRRGKDSTTGIMARLKSLGESQESHLERRLRAAKKGRKQLFDAGRIRKAAAKIK